MQTAQIRDQIARAIAHETATHTVRDVLANQAVAFVRGYVEAIPDLLDQAASAAAAAGITAVVAPLLDAAVQYFLEPNDLIPDVHGLAGLTDDAYLALGLIAAVSQKHAEQRGRPIFAIDFAPAHASMRFLLGPVIADQLDIAVLNAAATMYPQLAAGLAAAASPMTVSRDPYRGLSLDKRVELAKAGTLIL